MLREDLRTVRGSAQRDRSGLASVICDTSTSRSTSWCSRLLKMTSRSCPGSLEVGHPGRWHKLSRKPQVVAARHLSQAHVSNPAYGADL